MVEPSTSSALTPVTEVDLGLWVGEGNVHKGGGLVAVMPLREHRGGAFPLAR